MKSPVYSAEEDAVLWYERLHRDKVAESTRSGFEAWLEASPEHRLAYEAVQRSWAVVQDAAEHPSVLALRHEAALRLTRRTSHRMSPLRLLAAAAAVAIIAAGLLAALGPTSLSTPLTAWLHDFLPGESHYVTGTGERLATTLRDGTQVTLDTQSELEVAFTPSVRLVRLKRGQAFFEVAKDKMHPFVVEANDRRLIAVGTAFDVRLDGGQTRVTMVEGTVRVEPLNSPLALGSPVASPHGASAESPGAGKPDARATAGSAGPQTLISAGEQLWVDEKSEDHVRAADPERATSWRRGQLIFDAVRLGDAVEELNRYSEKKIELGDASLADIRISGSFATGRTDVFVEAITSYFPIDAAESSDRAVVLRPRR